MYKSKPGQLPNAEFDIMRVLWDRAIPMSAIEIVGALSLSRSWKNATAHVLLKRLHEKGFIASDRKGHTHKYTPLVSESEYRGSLIKNIIGGSLKNMVASLIGTDEVSDDEIFEIADMLDRKRDEIRKRGSK